MVSWQYHSRGSLPPNAVWGGKDTDGSDLYIGRALHERDLLPGKVSPSRGGLFVAYAGNEHNKPNYEVMCNSHSVAWQECCHGHVPHRAIQGGHTIHGEPLYIGRVWHQGSLTPGKIHKSHGKCYIGYGGKEIGYDRYEILISVC